METRIQEKGRFRRGRKGIQGGKRVGSREGKMRKRKEIRREKTPLNIDNDFLQECDWVCKKRERSCRYLCYNNKGD